MKRPVFNYSKCTSCNACVQFCPVSVLSMTRRGRQRIYRNVFPEITGEGCTGCGDCAAACVMGCISIVEKE